MLKFALHSYLPKRYMKRATFEQSEVSRHILEFKDGRVDASGYFLTAIAKLGLSGTLTILFMPCSNERNYYIRFRALAKEFGRYKELDPELYSMTYIWVRKSKHR